MPKTAFILGAGASAEVNLPVGNKLTESIGSLLDIRFKEYRELISGDPLLWEAFQYHASQCDPPARDINSYRHAAVRISEAMPLASSIDTFIDGHRGDKLVELCGKLAIARAILSAEHASQLYTDVQRPGDLLKQASVKDTWFNSFWKLFSNGCTFDQLGQRAEAVKFVVFNYDRCLEQFLYHATQSYYGVNSADAEQLLEKITIYHPYGSIAPLPWTGKPGSIPYGAQPHSTQLLKSVDQLRTFTETTDPTDELITKLRADVAQADRIVFLGFAFHRQNLDLLWPAAVTSGSTKKFYGTAKGISSADISVIAGELQTIACPQTQQYPHITCNEFFFEFWRSLSIR